MGIHSGIIANDEQILAGHGFERAEPGMTVDSEAIFALADEARAGPRASRSWLDGGSVVRRAGRRDALPGARHRPPALGWGGPQRALLRVDARGARPRGAPRASACGSGSSERGRCSLSPTARCGGPTPSSPTAASSRAPSFPRPRARGGPVLAGPPRRDRGGRPRGALAGLADRRSEGLPASAALGEEPVDLPLERSSGWLARARLQSAKVGARPSAWARSTPAGVRAAPLAAPRDVEAGLPQGVRERSEPVPVETWTEAVLCARRGRARSAPSRARRRSRSCEARRPWRSAAEPARLDVSRRSRCRSARRRSAGARAHRDRRNSRMVGERPSFPRTR